ncbi:hypothetical protein VTJ83DRAFT_3646 [Remersonia thermophila]|uniref:C2H2-type domain-containing protein n=1 Tax=Remersonia thermophila TaxID=72144 RepID=A0ABR4DF62_9PEZI
MFPRNPGTPWTVDSMGTTKDEVDEGRPYAVDSRLRHAVAAGDTANPTFGKAAMARISSESGSDSESARGSWVSFASASTSRTSGVPSIFSARASTASAITGYSARQSLLEDPIAEASQECRDHRANGCPPGPTYSCTFCGHFFNDRTEWKVHEFDEHDRPQRYACPDCPAATFPREAGLVSHLQDTHGHSPRNLLASCMRFAPIRSAWGCGFCAAPFTSRTDFLDHIGDHYDEGKGATDWQHTRVIEALLAQPRLAPAWRDLVNREETTRGSKLRFVWDSETTGRSEDSLEISSLQDVLEFFGTGSKTAGEVAAMALNKAEVRLEANVSDLINRLNLRRPDPDSSTLATAPKTITGPRWMGLTAEGDAMSTTPMLQPAPVSQTNLPTSPVIPRPPTPVPAQASPSSFYQRIYRSGDVPRAMTPFATGRIGTPSPPLSPRSNPLRRVDSARDLDPMKHAGALKDCRTDAESRRLRAQSPRRHLPVDTTPPPRSSSLPRGTTGSDVSPRASSRRALATVFATESSVRPHDSSSTLSTRTGDDSQRLDDSVGELHSDDSLSEPDFCLEAERFPNHAQGWMRVFQQSVSRGMQGLWVRYNRDWAALIRQCAGGRAGSVSQQSQTHSGRVRKGTSNLGPNGGRRPLGGPFGQDDEDEDDEGDMYRPPSPQSKRSPDGAKRFACPFRKHDPMTYNIHDHEVCAVRSWTTISRLKEHLYRRHYRAHCQRCKTTFGNAKELEDHEMSIVRCEVVDVPPPSDITTHQEKALKSRKHTTRRQSDEEKWRDIYRLLFPNQEVPSPYPEAAEDMSPSSELHINLNFQHFLLSEMPSLFTRTAEEHAGRTLHSHDVLPMGAIQGVLEEALQKAFHMWQGRGSEIPRRAASDASFTILAETPTSLGYTHEGSTAAYQPPLPAPATTAVTGNYTLSAAHPPFGNMDFPVPNMPHTTHADGSGFAGAGLFVTAAEPAVGFNAFPPPAAHYGREPWEPTGSGFGGMSAAGGFNTQMDMGGGYRGFRSG